MRLAVSKALHEPTALQCFEIGPASEPGQTFSDCNHRHPAAADALKIRMSEPVAQSALTLFALR